MSVTAFKEPSLQLLVKLGSIVAHVEEARSADGHHFDWAAVDALMTDPDVREWLTQGRTLALLPLPRKPHR